MQSLARACNAPESVLGDLGSEIDPTQTDLAERLVVESLGRRGRDLEVLQPLELRRDLLVTMLDHERARARARQGRGGGWDMR